MAQNIMNLRPTELVRLVNSTPLGQVLDSGMLYRHMNEAGYRIGDGKHVDLVRYVRWLAGSNTAKGPKTRQPADSAPAAKNAGQAHRERQAAKSRQQSSAVADIGEIPPVKDAALKAACRTDLLKFLTTHFPESTGLYPFSADHERVIRRIEHCVLHGGRFVNAVYRGFAKTTISENTAIWALLYGHRSYVPIFGSGQTAASDNIDSIQTELQENDVLYAQFPEVCHAVRALEGKPQRCGSQTHNGRLTHIKWTTDQIVLPSVWLPQERMDGTGTKGPVTKSPGGGGIIRAKGLGQASRGLKRKSPDGKNLRPDFIIIDDPQTDEQAASVDQVRKLRGIIKKSLLKSTGHFSSVAVVMNATVIEAGDLVETFLDHEAEPSWQGVRIPMVKTWGKGKAGAKKHETVWLGKYAALRNGYDPEDPASQEAAHAAADEYYRKNRKAMDAGCVVSWTHCYDHAEELSAIQHAYNSLIDDGEEVFASECQQQPIVSAAGEHDLDVKELALRLNGYASGQVPLDATELTAFVDVQGRLLYYVVVAWGPDFSGSVIDYGTWPDQKTHSFTARTAKRTLARAKPGAGLEGQIYNGLDKLTDELLGKSWKRDDGAELQIARCLIDANWGQSTDVVYQFCKQSPHSARLMPSHGKYYGAKGRAFGEFKKQRGEQVGLHWRLPNVRGRRQVRYVLIDTNYWKTFLAVRLKTAMGDPGALAFYGKRGQEHIPHAALFEQLTAERCVEVEANARKVDEWHMPDKNRDNHWWDCLVGAAVAASMHGITLSGGVHQATQPQVKRKTVSLASVKRNRRNRQ